MSKLDLTKHYKSYYSAKPIPEITMIEQAHYLSIKGKGDPNGKDFVSKIETLYPVAYSIKFMCKAKDQDFVVAKLEGIWSFDMAKYGHLSMDDAPKKIPRSEWNYRLLIRIPEYVTPDMVNAVIQNVIDKKKSDQFKNVEYFTLNEGKSIQILHIGPFSTEPESLKILAATMKANKLKHNGDHHEIYLSDFRKTPPEKLKTILREPVI
jgi:hypothetical protein